jgi:hypothetical protein
MRWFVSWVLWTLVMWVAFNQLLCGRTQGTSEKEIVEGLSLVYHAGF